MDRGRETGRERDNESALERQTDRWTEGERLVERDKESAIERQTDR